MLGLKFEGSWTLLRFVTASRSADPPLLTAEAVSRQMTIITAAGKNGAWLAGSRSKT